MFGSDCLFGSYDGAIRNCTIATMPRSKQRRNITWYSFLWAWSMTKFIGVVIQLMIGWIIIIAVILMVLMVGWFFFNTPNSPIIFAIGLFIGAISLLAYKIGNDLVGDLYD